jgi:hypothetical protein
MRSGSSAVSMVKFAGLNQLLRTNTLVVCGSRHAYVRAVGLYRQLAFTASLHIGAAPFHDEMHRLAVLLPADRRSACTTGMSQGCCLSLRCNGLVNSRTCRLLPNGLLVGK